MKGTAILEQHRRRHTHSGARPASASGRSAPFTTAAARAGSVTSAVRWPDADGQLTQRISGPRVRALFRLLHIPTKLPPHSKPRRRPAAPPRSHRRPLPASLRRRIEHLVELRHHAGRWNLHGGDLFVVPRWLAATTAPPPRVRTGPLRIHVDASRTPRLTLNGDAQREELASITLSPRAPALWRRNFIIDTAAIIHRDLNRVLGAPPTSSAWLAQMVSAPEIAEQAAIAVWNEFLAAVDVPLGLRVPDFELSLADLLVVLSGPRGGRDREWFANHWPAAAAARLRAHKATEDFRRIDANRAAAVKVATAAFCCHEREDCSHARLLAREIPKYREDPCLSRVLAGHGQRSEVHIRAILAWANQRENGALLSRIARCSRYTREQMELAAETAVQPVWVSGACRMAMGQLVVRTFAGSGFDPAGLAPASIAAVFTAVSADCLAAIATDPLDVAADRLETGVAVFANALAEDKWRLSPAQFTRFIAAAERHTTCLAQWTARFREYDRWPLPAAWRQEDSPLVGATITPLLSQKATRQEGDALGNCLTTTNPFEQKALLGHLALFSIQARDARATLALRPVERRGMIQAYELAHLKGPQNAAPHVLCQTVARSLVERLNARLPIAVPAAVRWWRKHLHLGHQRRFNTNTDVANDRWRQYVTHLPKRFQSTLPGGIVGVHFS